MTPDFAKALASMTLPEIAGEWKATRKVIAAVPDAQTAYRPHEKSMTALDLAWHIAATDIWFLEGIAAGQFGPGGERPETVRTAADCLAYFDSKIGPATAAVEALTAEQLAEPVDFFGVFNLPRVAYLNILLKHSIHHRGQLSAYLRPMGAKVPGIYGGSADEPFEPTAESAGA